MGRALRILLGGLALLLVLGLAAIWILLTLDVKAYAVRYASDALGRRVAIGALEIGWSAPLAIEADEVRVAGAEWSSEPDMLRIAHVSARLDVAALLGGRLRFLALDLEHPELLLERKRDGTPNWRVAGERPGTGGLVLIPHRRQEVPSLLDARLAQARLVYRRADRPDLVIEFSQLAVAAPDDTQPIHLEAEGSYQGQPARVVADTAGFAALRDESRPFATRFSLDSRSAHLAFDGNTTNPLDFDGIAGTLDLTAADMRDLGAWFGWQRALAQPFAIAGALVHDDPVWTLDAARGTLARSAFAGRIRLTEGARGEVDDLVLTLEFADLDLLPLMSESAGSDFDITFDPDPGAHVTLDLAARRLIYRDWRFADLVLRAHTDRGRISLLDVGIGLFGGHLTGSGQATATGAATRLHLDLAIDGAQAAEVARLMGGEPGDIAGPFAGRAVLDATAATVAQLLQRNGGAVLLAMPGGHIARTLIERASTDLRALFRKGDGAVPITCAQALLTLANGVLTVKPLRLHTAETVVRADGRIDAARRQLDLEISARGGTSLLALDVPVRISGSFDRFTVQPAIGSALVGETQPMKLPVPLADYLKRSACPS